VRHRPRLPPISLQRKPAPTTQREKRPKERYDEQWACMAVKAGGREVGTK
jgi:hypothetical protein